MKRKLFMILAASISILGLTAQVEPSFNISFGTYGVQANFGLNPAPRYYRHHHRHPRPRYDRPVPVFIVDDSYYYDEPDAYYYKMKEKQHKRAAKYYKKQYKKAKHHHGNPYGRVFFFED